MAMVSRAMTSASNRRGIVGCTPEHATRALRWRGVRLPDLPARTARCGLEPRGAGDPRAARLHDGDPSRPGRPDRRMEERDRDAGRVMDSLRPLPPCRTSVRSDAMPKNGEAMPIDAVNLEVLKASLSGIVQEIGRASCRERV